MSAHTPGPATKNASRVQTDSDETLFALEDLYIYTKDLLVAFRAAGGIEAADPTPLAHAREALAIAKARGE